jgi:hypothetical protein
MPVPQGGACNPSGARTERTGEYIAPQQCTAMQVENSLGGEDLLICINQFSARLGPFWCDGTLIAER